MLTCQKPEGLHGRINGWEPPGLDCSAYFTCWKYLVSVFL